MTQQSINAIVVGLGVHGAAIATKLSDAGFALVGAADPKHAGARLADVTGSAAHADIEVRADISEVDATGADIAVLTAKVPVRILVDLALRAFDAGCDAITIVEDAFDLERFAPEEYARLDAAARASGKTFVATGSQDVLWAGLVVQMSSQLSELTELNIATHLGVDGYPEEFVTWCGIGNTHEQFRETAAEAGQTPSVFGAVLPVIAAKLGLTVTDEQRDLTPVLLDEPLPSQTLGRDIPAGEPVGRRDVVTIETAEGIRLTAELQTTGVMECDEFTAEFVGTPHTVLRHKLEPANVSVDAALINRIADVVTAPAGVVRTVDLPLAHYRVRPAERNAEANVEAVTR